MAGVLAGIGAIGSLIQNNQARQDAKGAAKRGRRLEDRSVSLFDLLFGRAKSAVEHGFFSPEQRIAEMEKRTGRYEGEDIGNLAGGLRTLGYRPGDSEIGTRLDTVKLKYRNLREAMTDQIRNQSFWDEQNALTTANPNYLAPAIQGANREQDMALSRIQNPSSLLEAWMSTLQKPKQSGFNIQGLAHG